MSAWLTLIFEAWMDRTLECMERSVRSVKRTQPLCETSYRNSVLCHLYVDGKSPWVFQSVASWARLSICLIS